MVKGATTALFVRTIADENGLQEMEPALSSQNCLRCSQIEPKDDSSTLKASCHAPPAQELENESQEGHSLPKPSENPSLLTIAKPFRTQPLY